MLIVFATKTDQVMDITTAQRLIEILSVPRERAMTAPEVCQRYYGLRERGTDERELRKIQRDLKSLSEPKGKPALVKVEGKGKGRRFYVERSTVARWLMTEEAALNILLTQQLLGKAFFSVSQIKAQEIGDLAEKVSQASEKTTRIRDKVRIVEDWIGREPATIPRKVLNEVFDAVAENRQVKFTYIHSNGDVVAKRVSPQGLVAKDGSIYLLGTEGLDDIPCRGLPLHRMTKAECTNLPAQFRPDFDLDRYIKDTGQLSHAMSPAAPPVLLKIRVAPETIYHFKERPLSPNQEIKSPSGGDPWFVVTDSVPNTILLVPFLLSMGGWIEVLEPALVRNEMAKRVQAMAAHY